MLYISFLLAKDVLRSVGSIEPMRSHKNVTNVHRAKYKIHWSIFIYLALVWRTIWNSVCPSSTKPYAFELEDSESGETKLSDASALKFVNIHTYSRLLLRLAAEFKASIFWGFFFMSRYWLHEMYVQKILYFR